MIMDITTFDPTVELYPLCGRPKWPAWSSWTTQIVAGGADELFSLSLSEKYEGNWVRQDAKTNTEKPKHF